MKLTLVAALCGLALAAYSPLRGVDQRWFAQEKEFVYGWDSQLATGLPETIRSASRLTATDFFEPVEITEEQRRALELPLRFRFESGFSVSELEFDEQDPTWSRNLKRAALNMLHLSRNQENSREDETEKNYRLQETTLEGVCDVVYTKIDGVSESEERTEEEETVYTKSIDFAKCSRRPHAVYNVRLSDECRECDVHVNKINKALPEQQQNTVMRFRVLGSSERFLIREVELSSKYVYAPISDEQPLINTEVGNETVVAKMTLLESGELKTRMPTISAAKKTSLMHSNHIGRALEKWAMTGEEKYLKESQKGGDYEQVEAAKKTLKELEQLVREKVEVESTHMFSRLVMILRRCTYKQIEQIHREANKMEETISTLLIDAVAEAGTKSCVDYIIKLTINEEITPLRASYLMKTLSTMRLPSEQIIDELNRLVKDSVCQKNAVLEQSIRLTQGVLINGLCGTNKDKWAHERDEVCPRELKEKLIDELRRQYTKATTRYEKTLALKTIANAGLEMSVNMLEKIIFDRSEEPTIRMQAIDSLRLLRTLIPRRVALTLMPVIKSRAEPSELRITALYHLIHSQPERQVLEQIADLINRDSNVHVAAYAYSMLKQTARSENPCEKELRQRCELTLRLVNTDVKFRCQQTLLSSGSIELSSVFSNNSMLPKELMASVDALFAGHWNKNFLQIGATQKGLDRVLRNVLPKVASIRSIDDVVTRGKRSIFESPKQMLQGLFEKLNIVSRPHSESAEQDPHAVVYIRYRNMDYALIPVEEEVITQWLKNAVSGDKLSLGELERVLAQGTDLKIKTASMLYEISRVIPTTFGMPVKINTKMPLVASVELRAKADLLPKSESRRLEGVEVTIKGEPQLALTHLTQSMVLSPLVHTGLKLQQSVHLRLPVDAQIKAEYRNQKLTVETLFKAPREEKLLVKVLTRPATFVRKVATETEKYAEPLEKAITIPRFERFNKEIDNVYGKELFGLGFRVAGHMPTQYDKKNLLPLVASEKMIEIYSVPSEESPREYKIRSETEFFVDAAQPDWTVFDSFFTNDNRKHFAVEQVSEESFEESEREELIKKNTRKSGVEAVSHRTKLSVEALGGEKERKAELELKAVCEKESFSKCHIRVTGRRSPLMKGEREECNVEANLYTMYPEEVSSLTELKERKQREFHAMLKATFGCAKTNEVVLKLQGEQNKEMKKWISLVDKATRAELDSFKLLKEAGYLNQYKLDAEYNLDKQYEHAIEQVFQLLKVWNFWSTDVEMKTSQAGRVSVLLEVEPENRRYINLTINTPENKVRMESIRMPYRLPLLNLFHPVEVRSYKVHELNRDHCEVRSEKIRTFDDVLFKNPLTTCYSVVAKDCSEERTFAVLVKKVGRNGEEKKLKIVDNEKSIELFLEDGEMRFVVNGKNVREESIAKHDIVKLADRVYKVDLEKLSVRFDGRVVRVELSQELKGRQCGLCGHYDDDRHDEFRGADNKHTDDLEEFQRSYFARDQECEIEEEKISEKKNYGRMDQSSSEEMEAFDEVELSRAMSEEEEPIERQQMIEYSQKTCFSRTAIKECPRGEPFKAEKVTLRFVCFPRESKEARRFTREIRRDFVSLEQYDDSFTQPAKSALKCRA
ncbi:unnamed protein product, partial [Mesorhabditis spiculigera]